MSHHTNKLLKILLPSNVELTQILLSQLSHLKAISIYIFWNLIHVSKENWFDVDKKFKQSFLQWEKNWPLMVRAFEMQKNWVIKSYSCRARNNGWQVKQMMGFFHRAFVFLSPTKEINLLKAQKIGHFPYNPKVKEVPSESGEKSG